MIFKKGKGGSGKKSYKNREVKTMSSKKSSRKTAKKGKKPLWAKLRLKHGFAGKKEKSKLKKLSIAKKTRSAGTRCTTSCELTPGICQETCEKTDQGCLSSCETTPHSELPAT